MTGPGGEPLVAQGGPVIPDFGEGSDCVVSNRLFCPDWVRDNWSDVLQPALVEHIELTLIAVAVGFVLSLARGARHPPVPRARAALRDVLGRSCTRSRASPSSSSSCP